MTEYSIIKKGLQSLKNQYPFKVLKRIDKGNNPFFIVLGNDEGFKVAICHLETAYAEGIGYLIEKVSNNESFKVATCHIETTDVDDIDYLIKKESETIDYLKIQDEIVMREAGDMSPGLEIFKDKELQKYSCTIPSPFGKDVTELFSKSVRIVGLTIDEMYEAISEKKELKLTATKSISNLYKTEEIVCKAEIV